MLKLFTAYSVLLDSMIAGMHVVQLDFLSDRGLSFITS